MSEQQIWQGRLEDVKFPHLLSQISRNKETGILHVSSHQYEKLFYFEEGKVVFARTNDPDESLGVILLRTKKITCGQLEECAPKVIPGKRLGTVLVLEKYLHPDDLYRAVIEQIKEIIYNTFQWDQGAYRFESRELPEKEVITLNLSTPDVVLAGINRVWRWSWIKQGVVSLDTVFRKRDGWSPIVRKMTLTPQLDKILDLFDRPRTLEEILQNSPLGNFETCKIVWAFLITGVVEEILSSPAWYTPEAPPVQSQMSNVLSPLPIMPPITQPVLSPDMGSPGPPTVKIDLSELPIAQELDIQKSELASALGDADFNGSGNSETDGVALIEEKEELSFADLADLTDQQVVESSIAPQPASNDNGRHWIEKEIANFNEKQRFIFEMVRLDLGDQTSSFLSRVLLKAFAHYALLFEGVSINDFGEFNEQALAFNIEMNLVKNYCEALNFVVEEERELIRALMEGRRSQAVDAGLQRIESKQKESAIS